MDISFRNNKTARIFNEEENLEKKHGSLRAKKIRIRMASLRAARTLADFSPPYRKPERCHELTEGKRKGQLSMDLDHPYRLIFVPDHDPQPERPEGGLAWSRVTAIIILGIEDTHD